jgi:hypothetical protein
MTLAVLTGAGLTTRWMSPAGALSCHAPRARRVRSEHQVGATTGRLLTRTPRIDVLSGPGQVSNTPV